MNDPTVSLIIPTSNEEKNIARCLDSVFAQDYPKESVETIIVDNHSKDKTVEIAKQYPVKIFEQGPERSAQRNRGARESKGDYLLFRGGGGRRYSPQNIKPPFEGDQPIPPCGGHQPALWAPQSCLQKGSIRL